MSRLDEAYLQTDIVNREQCVLADHVFPLNGK